jgi:AcrR family transcriptional regulator
VEDASQQWVRCKCYKLAVSVTERTIGMSGKQQIAEQSKEWLWAALLRLMAKENFADISITEIAQEADLSRRTFYRAFKSKDDLVDYFTGQLTSGYFDALLATVKDDQPITIDDTLNVFFHYFWQQRDLVRLLIKQGLFDRANARWLKQATTHYDLFPAPWHPQNSDTNVLFIVGYMIGGFAGILKIWLGQDDPEPPAQIQPQMIAALKQFAAGIMTAQ